MNYATIRRVLYAYLFVAVAVSNWQVAEYKRHAIQRGHGVTELTKVYSGLVFSNSFKSFFFIN